MPRDVIKEAMRRAAEAYAYTWEGYRTPVVKGPFKGMGFGLCLHDLAGTSGELDEKVVELLLGQRPDVEPAGAGLYRLLSDTCLPTGWQDGSGLDHASATGHAKHLASGWEIANTDRGWSFSSGGFGWRPLHTSTRLGACRLVEEIWAAEREGRLPG